MAEALIFFYTQNRKKGTFQDKDVDHTSDRYCKFAAKAKGRCFQYFKINVLY